MASPLTGPPEIQDSNTINPFMDLMVSTFNKSIKVNDLSSPQKGRTENGADTYLSADNPCLDFFFHVVPSTPKKSLEQRLQAAWDHDALTTLKLICNLRGVRGTGKSDKEGFYTAALWLHGHHPKTLASNIEQLSEFGYFKDFPEILYRILKVVRKMRIEKAEMKNQEDKAIASTNRKQVKISMGKEAFTRYSQDVDYRYLHERVSDLFADHLRRDVEFLNSGETNKISLAAKWCPSLDSSFDKATLLCERIARKIFPRESFPEYEGVEEAHYAYRVRDRLRKQVLVPLRKTLQLPEVYMGARDWKSLPYNRVASVAMTTYKGHFLRHDEERFKKYLVDAELGNTKIAAGALFPHEIIGNLNGVDNGQVAELQWKRIVDDLKEKGSLTNCIAISDVSGSMSGIPMEVSVALGLLVSELSEEPWRGKLITFSANPEMHLVKGDDLRSKTEFVRKMDWGMNTDFQKVFDVILNVAVEGRLKPEEMIKRVFVFSDMEFDEAMTGNSSGWETDYEAIVRKFKERGYGEVVPEIVFWNLRDSWSTPVLGSQKGVALVSGFSKNMIKMFLNNNGGIIVSDDDGEINILDDDGEMNPIAVMEAAISGEEYSKLVVVD
ncbi:hypothetical protein EUTSA_v10015490mg [Eutrema salsugineum]|uniref:DUF2828 domain-containing protein n=1 Tax=Eutrema salsugineum TaxID=72664 RepID=V4LM31_EUTSA|nr:hypothetical protein EUTSA_v10015490mg [Eutrema salsugineum]